VIDVGNNLEKNKHNIHHCFVWCNPKN